MRSRGGEKRQRLRGKFDICRNRNRNPNNKRGTFGNGEQQLEQLGSINFLLPKKKVTHFPVYYVIGL